MPAHPPLIASCQRNMVLYLCTAGALIWRMPMPAKLQSWLSVQEPSVMWEFVGGGRQDSLRSTGTQWNWIVAMVGTAPTTHLYTAMCTAVRK